MKHLLVALLAVAIMKLFLLGAESVWRSINSESAPASVTCDRCLCVVGVVLKTNAFGITNYTDGSVNVFTYARPYNQIGYVQDGKTNVLMEVAK